MTNRLKGGHNIESLLMQALSNGSTFYFYGDLKRLRFMESADAVGQIQIVSEFTYTNNAWLQTDEKRRVFDGLDVVQERDANNNVTAQLVRDGNIGGILSRTTAAGATFYGYDDNGNVTLLTDSAGQDVGHYHFKHYAFSSAQTSTSTPALYKICGAFWGRLKPAAAKQLSRKWISSACCNG